jgi:hypothetical protein
MRLHQTDSEMNCRTKKQGMIVWAGYFEQHLQLHCCASAAELLQSGDPKSPPTQEMVAVWTSCDYRIARLCEHPIPEDTGFPTSAANTFGSLRIYPAWSRTG